MVLVSIDEIHGSVNRLHQIEIRLVAEEQKLFCVRRLATRRPVLSSNPLQQFLRQNLEDGLFGAEIVIEGPLGETAPIHDIAYVRGVQADRAEDFPSGCFNGSTILLFCDFSPF